MSVPDRSVRNETNGEDKEWNELLFSHEFPEPRSSAFQHTVDSLLQQRRKKRLFTKYAIAAACLLVMMSGALTVPGIAQYIQSFFKDDPVSDRGLLQAYETGIPTYPNISVADKNYRLKVNEIIADSTRVTLAVQLLDEKGTYQHDRLQLDGENRIYLEDPETGKKLASFDDIGATDQFNYLVAVIQEDFSGKNLTIIGDISHVRSNHNVISGNWSFNIPVHLEKNTKHTVNLQEIYTTTHGFQIELTRLVRTSVGGRLELKVTSPAAYDRELFKEHSLSFHLEDSEHNEISTVGSTSIGHMDDLLSLTKQYDEQSGSMLWTYTFRYMPEMAIRFVLDGYSVLEPSDEAFRFRPESLSAAPLSIHTQGDELLLTGFEQQNEGSVLRLQGVFINKFDGDVWSVADPEGNEYSIRKEGAYVSQNDRITLQKENSYTDYGFVIGQLPFQQGTELILKRKVIDKRYTSDWSVMLK